MNSKNYAPKAVTLWCVRTFLFLALMGFGAISVQAQSLVNEADAVDLLPEAVEVSQDLSIGNPVIHGTYTPGDIEAITSDSQLQDLEETALNSGTAYDMVKFRYYVLLNEYVLDWSMYPEDALLIALYPANEGEGLSVDNPTLRQLYLDTLLELDNQ